jgi:hypothetical protein
VSWPRGPSFGPIIVSPRSVAVDRANIQAALALGVTQGRSVYLRPGSYVIDTPINPPARSVAPRGITLGGHPNARLISTIAPGSPINPDNAPIYFAAGSGDQGVSTTLHTTATVGSSTIVVDASINVGEIVVIGNGGANLLVTAKVLARSGSGPTWTLTLDRTIPLAFTSGLDVFTYDPVCGFRLEAIQVRGKGGNLFEGAKAQDCEVVGVEFGPDDDGNLWSSIGASWDLGSRRSTFRQVKIDCAGGASLIAWSIESSDECAGIEVETLRAGAQAGWLSDPRGCVIQDCTSRLGAAEGLQISQATTYGSQPLGTVVRGGEYSKNGTAGVVINDAVGVTLDGVTTDDNVSDGVQVGGANTTLTITNHKARGNTNGIRMLSTAGLVVANGLETRGGTTGIYEIGGELYVTGWRSSGQSIVLYTQGKARVSQFHWVPGGGFVWSADLDDGGASDVAFSDGIVDVSNASVGVVCFNAAISGDKVSIDGVKSTGSKTSSKGIVTASGTTIRVGEIDFSSCAAPTTYGGTTNTVQTA